VGLVCSDEELRSYLPPHTTRAYLRRVLISLQKARPSGRTGAARSLHQAADRMKRRGLVIIISDLLDDPAGVIGALKHLRHKKNEVIVMHVLDPMERSFAFGSDAVFRDVETAERVTTLPWQIQASYRAAMAQFIDTYKRECSEHAIDYVMMDTETPFDVGLTEYLARRERLG